MEAAILILNSNVIDCKQVQILKDRNVSKRMSFYNYAMDLRNEGK